MAKATYHVKRSKIPVLIAIVCFVLQAAIHGTIHIQGRVGEGASDQGLKELSYGPWSVDQV
jgi:hypothetical protein